MGSKLISVTTVSQDKQAEYETEQKIEVKLDCIYLPGPLTCSP